VVDDPGLRAGRLIIGDVVLRALVVGEIAQDARAKIAHGRVPLSSKLKVVGRLQYDDKGGWSGPFKIDVLDAGGQVVFTDHGTFTLTRIAVESLD
jgi:hypothetical protein